MKITSTLSKIILAAILVTGATTASAATLKEKLSNGAIIQP